MIAHLFAALLSMQSAHPEPYLPPAKRIPSSAPAERGEGLRARSLNGLRRQFDAADSNRDGVLSQAEAEQARLGYIVQHYAEIAAAGKGRVDWPATQSWLQHRPSQSK